VVTTRAASLPTMFQRMAFVIRVMGVAKVRRLFVRGRYY
jgi:hypothetical protein